MCVCMCVCVCVCLLSRHFYHSCLHFDARITFSILKNISLTLRDACKELQKLSVTKTYSVGLNRGAELPYKK